jgi:hypothetical protein
MIDQIIVDQITFRTVGHVRLKVFVTLFFLPFVHIFRINEDGNSTYLQNFVDNLLDYTAS